MSTRVRAVAAVALIAGFYPVAMTFVAGVGLAIVWLAVILPSTTRGALVSGLGLGYAGLVVAVVGGLFSVSRQQRLDAPGVPLPEDEAPALWATVRELASRVGTRPPDEIRLVPEVNASVAEQTRLLGLIGGRRWLYLGAPLLVALSVDQLEAVLAHELGHYSNRHTSLGSVTYRGGQTIARTISRLGPSSIVGRLLRLYGRLYFHVEAEVRRRLEYEADRSSALIAGRSAALSALRELRVVNAAWDFYERQYLSPGMALGHAPSDVYGGFWHLLCGRRDELARLREQPSPAARSAWAWHPSDAERIAAIQAMTAVPADRQHPDGRASANLLADPEETLQALQASMLRGNERTVLDWPEFTAAAAAAASRRSANALYRCAAEVSGRASAGLSEVLDLLAAGALPRLAGALTGASWDDPEQRARSTQALAGLLWNAVAAAAVEQGAGRWRHSWSGPAQIVDARARELPLEDVVTHVLEEPRLIEAGRERLRALGIDVSAGRMTEEPAVVEELAVVAGIGSVGIGIRRHDVLILNRGLLLAPVLGLRLLVNARHRVLTLARSGPAADLVSGGRGRRWVPFTDIVRVRTSGRFVKRYALTLRSGRRLTLVMRSETRPIANGLKVLDEMLSGVGTPPS